MGAVRFRARVLLRGHRVATVGLGVLVGLAAAIPMIAWEATRRSEAALPAFLARSDVADVVVVVPPALDVGDLSSPEGEAALDEAIEAANALQDEARQRMLTLPEVRSAARGTFTAGAMELLEPPAEPAFAGFNVRIDPGSPPPGGAGLLVAGRWFDERAPDEAVVSEQSTVAIPGLGVGSRFAFTPFLESQGACASENLCEPGGPRRELSVVGVVRQGQDLAAADQDADGAELYLTPAYWAENPGIFTYGVGVELWAAPGVSPEELTTALEETWPDRSLFLGDAAPDEASSVDAAISYETRAGRAFALVTALTALVFLGEAVLRQASREAQDLSTLAALGGRRAQFAASAALRGLAMAGVAGAAAAVATVLGSVAGPFGVARRTVTARTMEVDATVLLVGVAAVMALTVGLASWPALVGNLRVRRSPVRRSQVVARAAASAWLPPSAMSGAAALPGGRANALPLWSAFAGSAVAVAAVVAAGVSVASLDHLLAAPVGYGVAWDVVAGNADSDEAEAAAFERLATIPGVSAAVGLYTAAASVGDEPIPLLGAVPVPGVPSFGLVVSDGRAPSGPGEVALGAVSMRRLGVGIGDTVDLVIDGPEAAEVQALVVGRAVLNDTDVLAPGIGALADPAWIRPISGGQAQQVAVRLDPSADRATVLAALEEAFPETVGVPPPPTDVRNLARVRNVPWMLVAVVTVLAAAALVHGLWSSVRGRRSELGVLRSLGFRRAQVVGSVCWQATFLIGAALLVGVPLGIVAGRVGWRLLADAIGVAAPPELPVTVVALVVVVALALANAIALGPGWRAARVRASDALRSE